MSTTEDLILRNHANVMDKVRGVLDKPALNAETVFAGKSNVVELPYVGGNDGPIREPGDTAPKRSDVYSDSDLCDLLGRHAISLARLGMTHIATDLDAACAALDERADQIEEARATVQRLLDKLTSLGYGNCPRDDRCLMNHDHAGGCVTSHSELARIRRAADEAESIDE